MSIRSIRAYVNQTLNGLAVPGITAPMKAVSYIPPVDVLDAPYVWVQASLAKESRIGGHRGAGRKERMIDIVLGVLWQINPDQSDPAQFDDIVESIEVAIRSVANQVQLTDTLTGKTSYLLSIGETMETVWFDPMAANVEGCLDYTAGIRATAIEEVVG